MVVYGIDFGFSECCAAHLNDGGKPVILRNQTDGSDTLASAIYFENPQKITVGSAAWNAAVAHDNLVVQYVPDYLGQSNARNLAFHGKNYTPVDLAAILLEQMKKTAEKQGSPMSDVVLACPSSFGIVQRNALQNACRQAGLHSLEMIDGPAAALLGYYGLDAWEERTVLVFDLGGTRQDVFVVKQRVEKDGNGNPVPGLHTLASGSQKLGGRDWDDLLCDHVLKVCCDENGLNQADIDAPTRQQIRTRSELAKKMLSFSSYTKVRINVNGSTTGVPVTREDFETMTAELVRSAMSHMRNVMNQAGNISVDQVLLVGGGCHMPMIRDALDKEFPGKIQYMDPELLTAKGAAVYGGLLSEGRSVSGFAGQPAPTHRSEKADPAPVENSDRKIPGDSHVPAPSAHSGVKPISGVYGIDFGTIASAIACLNENGEPVIIHNYADASEVLDSSVYFQRNGAVTVGAAAREMAETEPQQVVQYFKRDFDSADDLYEVNGKTRPVAELASNVLKRLREMVEEQGGCVQEAVLAFPATFGMNGKERLAHACEMAGLKLRRAIPEPQAVALSYCHGAAIQEKTVLVFDLGGSFKAAVLKLSKAVDKEGNPVLNPRITQVFGDYHLGCQAWDDRLYQHVLNVCCDENGLDESDMDEEVLQQIRRRIEPLKVKLSTLESAKAKINVGGVMTNVRLTRQEFEDITKDLLQKVLLLLDTKLQELGADSIDEVYLAGGGCHMPMVRMALEDRFPGKVRCHEPELAVVKGAAIFASMPEIVETPSTPEPAPMEPVDASEGTPDRPAVGGMALPVTLTAYCPCSIGILLYTQQEELLLKNLLKLGCSLPAEEEITMRTLMDNQQTVKLRLFENASVADYLPMLDTCEGRNADDRIRCIGTVEVQLPSGLPVGTPIKVTIRMENRGLSVRAADKATGQELAVTFHAER